MHRFLYALVLLSLLTSCKKAKENIQEKKVLDFITDGQWRVTQLLKGSTDYVADFAGYQFQFKTNNFVDAIKNGSVQTTGTWQGDAINFTITSTFPADAVQPLPLLNGLWKIVDGGNDFVVATKDENGELSRLRLQKV
jgi:hypothetical protein